MQRNFYDICLLSLGLSLGNQSVRIIYAVDSNMFLLCNSELRQYNEHLPLEKRY